MTFLSAIPVLRVGDYPAARRFWTEMLGFSLGEEGGEPPFFGIFKKDKAIVFVDAWSGADPAQHDGWRAYLHCDDVAALAADLTAKGLKPDGPRDTSYGMREVTVRDPAGNVLCFGQDLG